MIQSLANYNRLKEFRDMNTYECAFITKTGDKAVSKTAEELITSFGGSVVEKDDWGEKTFAYKIDGLSSGHYHIWTIQIDPSQIDALKNKMNLEAEIIRYLIMKK